MHDHGQPVIVDLDHAIHEEAVAYRPSSLRSRLSPTVNVAFCVHVRVPTFSVFVLLVGTSRRPKIPRQLQRSCAASSSRVQQVVHYMCDTMGNHGRFQAETPKQIPEEHPKRGVHSDHERHDVRI